MRLLLLLSSFLSIFAHPIYSAQEDQEIRVTLSTETPLTPIYLSLDAKNASLPAAYIESLRKVLLFDFSYDGESQLLPSDPAKEKWLAVEGSSLSFWKTQNVPYAVKVLVQEKSLSATIYCIQEEKVKRFEAIPLTGSLETDRRQLHKLSDGIHKAIFQREGIASYRILYSRQKPGKGDSWISEIWECDWDGANKRQVTRENSYSINPVMLSSSTDQFLYVSYKSGQPKIFLSSIQKGEGKRVIHLRGNQILPAISPQKNQIAFICDAASGRADLFVQNFDPTKGAVGKPTQLFSFPRSVQASPTFSPDGKKIAFVSDKDGSPRIYIIPSTTTGKRAVPTLLSKLNRENSCPSWSPDGKKIAYSAKTNGTRQIWIYDFEKGKEEQLTTGPGNKENPEWGPNSLHLVFNSVDNAKSDLYIMNLHQAKPVKITDGEGKNHYPSWGRK